jgi:hypothetical protein
MTSQAPRTSLLEAATQAAVGLPIGFGVVTAVSLLGLSPAASGALSAGAMFVVSTARGFWIRRRFEEINIKGKLINNLSTKTGCKEIITDSSGHIPRAGACDE